MRVRYTVIRMELPDNDSKAIPEFRTRIRRFKGQAQRFGKLFDAKHDVVARWEVDEQVPVAASEEGDRTPDTDGLAAHNAAHGAQIAAQVAAARRDTH